jgi:hypothetical protein
VSLTDKNGRKKRRDAAAINWSPESGEIRISFEADSPNEILPEAPAPEVQQEAEMPLSVAASSALEDLVRSLDRAESKPAYDFVALKWFRDVVLPGVRPEMSSEERNLVLREAIEKRLVLTNKVPNPKSPQFPVTALRLNRSLPETQAILGTHDTTSSEFQPVAIRGEAISTTILRERR